MNSRHLQTGIFIVVNLFANCRQTLAILPVIRKKCFRKIRTTAIPVLVANLTYHIRNAVLGIPFTGHVIGDIVVAVVVIGRVTFQQAEECFPEIGVLPRVDQRVQTGVYHRHVEEYFVHG